MHPTEKSNAQDVVEQSLTVDYEHLKYAPVLSLKVNADIDSIVKVGSQIEHTIFRNNERTVYEIVP